MVFLTSCATLEDQTVFYINKDIQNTDWKITDTDDPFRGNIIKSIVYSVDNNANYFVMTDQNGINYINYNSGDRYICADSYLTVQHIFIKGSQEIRVDTVYSMTSNSRTLLNKNSASLNGLNNLIFKLNNYDKMILRTSDNCGEQITNTFKIAGKTHLQEIL